MMHASSVYDSSVIWMLFPGRPAPLDTTLLPPWSGQPHPWVKHNLNFSLSGKCCWWRASEWWCLIFEGFGFQWLHRGKNNLEQLFHYLKSILWGTRSQPPSRLVQPQLLLQLESVWPWGKQNVSWTLISGSWRWTSHGELPTGTGMFLW